MQGAGLVGVENASNLAAVVVVELNYHTFRPDLEMAGALSFRDFGIKRRPLGADGAPRHTEPDLMASWPIIPWLGVDRHISGMDLGITNALGPGRHYLEIVVAGQTRNIVSTGDTHLIFGTSIKGLEFP